MAVEIVIKQKGLFKKPLTKELLAPAGLRVGHWNQAGVLDPDWYPYPSGLVLCDPVQPGRGCYVQAAPGEKNTVSIRQPLPCTPGDLELLYGLVETICRFWKTDRFTQDGEERTLQDIPAMKAAQNRDGIRLLKEMAERWQADGGGVLTGAVFPLYLEPETVERLKTGDLDFFQTYLAQKQQGDWYYAKPNFFQDKNSGGILGVYALTEEVGSIFPLQPFVPPLYSVLLQNFSLEDSQVANWLVSLNRVWEENGEMKGNTLGYIPFAQFAQKVRLDQCPRFDHKHVYVEVKDLSEVLS